MGRARKEDRDEKGEEGRIRNRLRYVEKEREGEIYWT